MNSEPHSHSCTAKWGGASAPVLGQWRTEKPYHTYPRLANGAPSPAHMTPLCALPLLSALDPGECGHHWRPDTGGIGRPLSSAEFNQALSFVNFIAIRWSWPSCRWERRRSAGEEPTFFFFRLQTSGETQGRDNNAQKLLKRIVSRRRYAYFFSLFIAYLLLQFQKVVEICIVYICTRLQF